ncbi:MAG: MBG domain-containing protein [Parvibaculum sp.]|uniref:beta strand repeat-containing protein n=1 Tax=Parvibaculum sp. TaxID=2024848 RepID=UPI003C75A3DB
MSKLNAKAVAKTARTALRNTVSYTAISIMMVQPVFAAGALPSGAQVVAGDVVISAPSANEMLINQSSGAGIVNWSDFSIGNGNSVQFNNGTGATLNRVTGATVSSIDGALSATGSVYLINSNGVIVGSSGIIDVGGSFVASTQDVQDSDFLNGGDLTFKGDSKAAIVNYGKLGALGGDVALIAAKVNNEGSIEAANGTAALAAGYEVLMRDASVADGKFIVKAGGSDTQARNAGAIKAADAELRAADGNVYALAGSTNGFIAATGVSSSDGRVFLTAEGGTVEVDGTVTAQKANGAGGTIVATADKVALGANARVNANGTKGGTILIGGDQFGGQDASRKFVDYDVANASEVTVASGAEISANGSAAEGGKVVFWSEDFTDYQGAVSTLGAGNLGGFAEVSSKGALNFLGTAETGETGMLLLDPYNLTIVSGTGGGVTSGSSNSTLGATTLQNLLASNNTVVSTSGGGNQSGNITVSSAVNWTSDRSLTLDAHNDITFNRAVTASHANAALILKADGSITDNSNGQNDGYVRVANLDIQNHSNSGSVSVTLDSSSNSVGTLTAGGNSTNARIGSLTFNNNKSLTVGSAGIYFNRDVSLKANGNNSDVTLTGALDTDRRDGSVSLTAGRNIAINNALKASGSNSDVTLRANGAIMDGTSGYIAANALSIQRASSGNNPTVTLDSTANTVTSITAGTSNARVGNFAFTNSQDLTVTANGIFSNGIVSLYAQGAGSDITLANGSTNGDGINTTRSANGTAITVAADGKFINKAGSNALTTGGSNANWLVYAGSSTGNTFGGLDSGNTAVWGVEALGAVSALGNRYVFANDTATNTLSVTLKPISKTYGDTLDLTSSSVEAASLTTSGHAAVTGAYKADTGSTQTLDATQISTIGLTSAGTAATANVGSYGVTAAYGALSTTIANGLSVAKAALTITASNASKVYGDLLTLTGYSVAGLKNSDSVSGVTLASDGTAVTANASDIAYAITASNAIGSGLSNYDIAYAGGALSVGQRAITVTANDQGRTYGDANPAFTYGVTAGNLVNDDALTGDLATLAGVTSNVGTYDITQGTVGASSNYAVTFVAGTLTIGQRAITVTADNKRRTYGDANPALTYRITSGNLVNGDTLTGGLFSGATAASDVGTYGILQGNLAASSNYNLGFNAGTLTVNKATLFVTANSASKTYGDVNPALTASYYGFKLNQDASVIDTHATVTTSATQNSNAGIYSIKAAGALDNNYNFTYIPGALLVNKAVLTVTADNKSKIYGDANPLLTATYSGFVLGQDASVIDRKATLATTGTKNSNVGNYNIYALAAFDNNYSFVYNTGTLAVTPATLTVTANSQTKVYGENDPMLGYTASGFKLGQGTSILSGSLSRDEGQNVGSYGINQGSLAVGSNYTINYVGNDLTITQRMITVTADNLRKLLGKDDPALTWAITNGNLVNGDEFAGDITRDAGSLPGDYAITQGTLGLSSNYALAFINGTFTIDPLTQAPGTTYEGGTADQPTGSTVASQTGDNAGNGGDGGDVTGSIDGNCKAADGICVDKPYPSNWTPSEGITFISMN